MINLKKQELTAINLGKLVLYIHLCYKFLIYKLILHIHQGFI